MAAPDPPLSARDRAPRGDPPLISWRAWLRRRRAWLLLSLGLLALVTVLALTQPLPRLDRMLQDNTAAAMTQPATDQVVIVAIDDKSLAALGRWPWRRATHAELLRRIAAQQPRCIGLDLLMDQSDPQYPDDDLQLAEAMRQAGCVVLPMALRTEAARSVTLLPVPALADAATAIGHAQLAIDNDGVVRSLYLREGYPHRLWPAFARALYLAARGALAPQPPALRRGDERAFHEADGGGAPDWQRSDRELIVFAPGDAPLTTVSYIDVLRGAVPPDVFRGRYVLVGATAQGLGEAYATPATNGDGLVKGVEIFANVLDNQLHGYHVVPAMPWQDLLFNLLPLAAALLGLLWLGPVGALVTIVAMLALRLRLQVIRPSLGVQFMPASGFIGLLLVYPLWALWRLGAALGYLRWGTEQLSAEFADLHLGVEEPDGTGDFLDRQMAATTAAMQRIRDVRRFMRDGIDHLPDATLVLDTRGRVLLANLAAQHRWRQAAAALREQDAQSLLGDIAGRPGGAPLLPHGALLEPGTPIVAEGEDAQGRVVLLRCVPFFNAANVHAGWLVSLVDITPMRQAQGQRDQALSFISHDIREPNASILTTIELARQQPDNFSFETLLARIERQAHTGLALADGFVNLVRAEAQPFRAEPLDLVALIEQAADNSWARAHRHQVELAADPLPEEAPCLGDRSLLMRALANILSNAVKYAPAGSTVRYGIAERAAQWALTVRDQGPGIPAELQSQLFQPYRRLHRHSHPDVPGVGLGLLLVRTAAQRHGGSVEIDSAAGAGCTVTLLLPRPSAAELESLWQQPKE